MSKDRRKEFIRLAAQILREEGLEGISIRRIAKEVGCTSTVIYRYFDNIDQLINIASVYFLQPYINEYIDFTNNTEKLDPYTLNLRMWRALSYYAFQHIEIYERLFFHSGPDGMGDYVYEYYSLFIDDKDHTFDGYSASIMFDGKSLFDRDFILLRRAANMGIITLEQAHLLSNIEPYIFHGMLLRYQNTCKDMLTAKKLSDEFMSLLYELEAQYRKK